MYQLSNSCSLININQELVQTDPSEKIDLPTQRAFQGFLTFLSSIRCPLRLTNFSKLFHVG